MRWMLVLLLMLNGCAGMMAQWQQMSDIEKACYSGNVANSQMALLPPMQDPDAQQAVTSVKGCLKGFVDQCRADGHL